MIVMLWDGISPDKMKRYILHLGLCGNVFNGNEMFTMLVETFCDESAIIVVPPRCNFKLTSLAPVLGILNEDQNWYGMAGASCRSRLVPT